MAKVSVQVLGNPTADIMEDVQTVLQVKTRKSLTNYTATVNGESVEDNYQLSDHDFLTLSPPVKGG